MNSVNGHAQKDSVPTSGPPPRMLEPGVLPLPAERISGLAAFARVLGSLRLNSLDQVDNLRTLQEIVVALEG